MSENYHEPVMLSEVLQNLEIQENGTYVDATFGGGGHSRHILSRLGSRGRLIAFDRDPDAALRLEGDVDFTAASEDGRFTLIGENFRYLRNHLRFRRALPVDGILADLGVSSHQFDVAERGFSTRLHGPLDMRMEQSGDLTAADILNTYSEEELQKIFSLYGELPNAGRLASAVVNARTPGSAGLQTRVPSPAEGAPIFKYTDTAATFFEKFAPRGKENRYLAQVFQALRIEVNGELEALQQLLQQSLEVLKPGGRLVVISYHSLEDRMVKNFMRTGNVEGKEEKDFYGNRLSPVQPVIRKALVPTEEEIERNSRARSAKLRVAEIKTVPDHGQE